MDQKKTGKFISDLRKERSMTQRELADKIGVSDKTVSKWETGRGLPEISIMQVLCSEFGISINELLSGERLDDASYRERAEENMARLLKPSGVKELLCHIAVSTVPFLGALMTFPLAAGKLIPPELIPVILFLAVLFIVGNLAAGITYGSVKKRSGISPAVSFIYNAFLLCVLVGLFTMVTVIFFGTKP